MTIEQTEFDSAALREAYGQFPTGVVALCSEIAGTRVGMVASSFVGVSLDPPLAGVFIQRDSRTWPVLASAGRLGVSVLGETHATSVSRLAGRDDDRFQGLATVTSGLGSVFLDGASCWFDVTVEQQRDAGDHLFALLGIRGITVRDQSRPIVFHASTLRRMAAEE